MKPVAESSKAADTERFEREVGVWKPTDQEKTGSAATLPEPNIINQRNTQMKSTNLSQNVKSGDIVSITLNTNVVTKDDYGVSHDHGNIVVGEVCADNTTGSLGLYLAPELEVQVSIPAECVVSVEVMTRCGNCEYFTGRFCEAWLPPEDDILARHEVTATDTCEKFQLEKQGA